MHKNKFHKEWTSDSHLIASLYICSGHMLWLDQVSRHSGYHSGSYIVRFCGSIQRQSWRYLWSFDREEKHLPLRIWVRLVGGGGDWPNTWIPHCIRRSRDLSVDNPSKTHGNLPFRMRTIAVSLIPSWPFSSSFGKIAPGSHRALVPSMSQFEKVCH